jgi:hypothetical protein
MEQNKIIKNTDEYSVFTHDPEYIRAAKCKISSLPILGDLEGKIAPLNAVNWDYAIEITTDDLFVLSEWYSYHGFIDEIYEGISSYGDDIEKNVLTIVSCDKSSQMLKMLILVASNDYDYNDDSHKCFNLKLHRQFYAGFDEYRYKKHSNSGQGYISVNDIEKLSKEFEFEGQLHYLPYRAQLPFLKINDLVDFELLSCSVQ